VNRIHGSKETAQLLIEAGKSDWVKERNELVAVKGKGQMQTFWVNPSIGVKRKKTPRVVITCKEERIVESQ
jgi:hypothetical protein